MRALAALAAVAVAVSGCGLGMDRQAKYRTQAPAPLFPDDTSAQVAPEGTVSQGQAGFEAAAARSPPVTTALMARGRERFSIYCQPCHGSGGLGDGTVVQRGFPRPPSYAEPRLLAAPPGHVFDVITNGYGVMYPYRDRLDPADRWAVVAYVRALQLARTAKARGAS